MSDDAQRESWVGYVIDIACVRRAPSVDLLDRTPVHPIECALMGHCIEPDFAVVDYDGGVRLLEPSATPDVVQELLSTVDEGLRLQATRELDGHEMRTVELQSVGTGQQS